MHPPVIGIPVLLAAEVVLTLGFAWALQASTQFVAGFRPNYWRAWFAVCATSVIAFLFGFFWGIVMSAPLDRRLITGVVAVAQTVIYAIVVGNPQFGSLGLWRAFLVGIVEGIIVLIAALVIGFLLGLFAPSIAGALIPYLDPRQPQQDLLRRVMIGALPGTPHPAVASRQATLQKYPALGVPHSPLNTKFLSLFERAKVAEPELLARSDWPSILAERAMDSLDGNDPNIR